LVQGIIAGGYEKLVIALLKLPKMTKLPVVWDLKSRGFSQADALVGIAASGRTPYTVGAITRARSLGSIHCGSDLRPEIHRLQAAEINIVPVVRSGSTGRHRRAMKSRHGTEDGSQYDLDPQTMARLGYVTGKPDVERSITRTPS